MNVKIISAVLILALSSLACGVSVDLPERLKAGDEIKESITVAKPDVKEAQVNLSFGAGDLILSGGAENLVDGTVTYNVRDLKPRVTSKNGSIEIKQGNFENIPPIEGMKNEWDLKLGATPMDLIISAGAYNGTLDLGGLALQSLTITDGASDVTLSFSEPNLTEMSEFWYTTGASDVTIKGLANANFKTFLFNSGAGNYNLDFSGELQRDATVSVDCGLSDLTIVIPKGVKASVSVDSALANVNFGEGWTQKGRTYSQAGEGPALTVVINIGGGDVNIRD